LALKLTFNLLFGVLSRTDTFCLGMVGWVSIKALMSRDCKDEEKTLVFVVCVCVLFSRSLFLSICVQVIIIFLFAGLIPILMDKFCKISNFLFHSQPKYRAVVKLHFEKYIFSHQFVTWAQSHHQKTLKIFLKSAQIFCFLYIAADVSNCMPIKTNS
jgi:hypothetical protein